MNRILLRRARPDDAEVFARFTADEVVFAQVLQLPFPDAAIWRTRLEKTSEPGRPDIHLVGELDGKVVGSANLYTPTENLRRRHALGLGICVGLEGQGQGVGCALMKALLDYADRWAGVLRIELTVWVDNERAIALYRRFGFEIEGRLRAFALRGGDLVDAFTMARLHPHPPVPVQLSAP